LGLLGGFRGWPIQWNHAKCCGADPCCHGNEIWARRGDPVAYRLVYHVCAYFQKYVILIEEEVIPTTDFLLYLSQCLPILEYDETLIGATAWNENGRSFSNLSNTLLSRSFSRILGYISAFVLKVLVNILY